MFRLAGTHPADSSTPANHSKHSPKALTLDGDRPGLVAVGIYSFMTSWGELLFASVLTNGSTQTLAIGLQQYSTQVNVYWNQIMAASLVVSVPVVVAFLLLQRAFVAGLTAGAVK